MCGLSESTFGAVGIVVFVLDVHFARSDDVDVAYHVVGDGPIDIIYVQGAWSHLQVNWELPAFRRFCERLGEFSRVILFDKRGMGMSSRVPGGTPLDVRMDDVRAGSLDHVSAFAGYLQAKSGKRYIVVTLQNHNDIHRGPGQEVQEALLRWLYQK